MKIENLCMSFGTQTIFDNISFQINNNDKVGIIGVNGAGKSTLFNILLGNITPDAGNITLNTKINLGYLPQVIMDDASNEEETVFEYLLEGRPIKELKEELNSLYEIIARTQDEYELKKYYKKINCVSELLEYYDEYNAESSLLKIISGMNIDDNLLDLKLKNISGGQKSKVAFARLLYSNPEIMLLDEPTNHLDLDTKDYIINYLKNYHGIILVISHDIEFLNEVTKKTLYVDKIKHNVEMYNVNYEKYIKIKNERDLAKKRLYERQQKEEEKLKGIIAKYIRGNEKKANIAKDRIKKLEKLESEKVELEKKNKYTKFNMKINRPSYSVPIKCNNLTFGYDEENLLYENLNFDLSRGEKLLVVGENGIGKTTLLRLIMGYLKPLEGNIEITENKFGFIFVPSEDLKKFNVEATSVSNQVNDFYFIKELICWMFVVYDERNDIYKANIRSRGPIINEVAAKYNGGGHKFASGCRTDDYKVIEALAKDLDATCEEYFNEENI